MTRTRTSSTALALGIAAVACVLALQAYSARKDVSRLPTSIGERATASSPGAELIPPSVGTRAIAHTITPKTDAPSAAAQGARLQLAPTAVQLRLALQVARVAANEGALHNHADAALIWQAVRVNGDKARDGRLGWLRRHSKRVAGIKACSKGNCLWTRNLTRSKREPVGYIAGSADWRDITADAWTELLRYVDGLVSGDSAADDPCPLPPRTWGNAGDRQRAINDGLYPFKCAGALNFGFVLEADCMVRGEWLCDPVSITPRRARVAALSAAEARPR